MSIRDRLADVKPSKNQVIAYGTTLLVTSVFGLFVFQPWAVEPGVLAGGGDGNWLLANYESVSQVGIFAHNPHLAWPNGYSVWSLPQLGYFQLLSAALLPVLGVSSALAVALYIQVLIMPACGLATLFLTRSVTRESASLFVVVASIAVGISPYLSTATIIAHQNVSAFFAVPAILGIVIRSQGKPWRRWITASAVAAVIIALSSLWWIFVIVLLLSVVGVGLLLQRRWSAIANLAVIAVGVGIGTLTQLIPFRLAAIKGEPRTRGPWDSNFYGGHFTDLLTSSPAIREWVPRTSSLMDGASREARFAGLIFVIAAACAILLVLKGPARRLTIGGHRADTRTLAIAMVAALLMFVGGGIGNAQAGLAVLLGGASPARVWSRLLVILAVIGLVWVCAYVARWWSGSDRRAHLPRAVYAVAVVLLAVIGVYEPLRGSLPPNPTLQSLPEYGPVNFIASESSPCPVAQLPVDGTPIPRVLPADPVGVEAIYYRPFIPYLVNPSYYWSFGSWLPKGRTTLDKLPATLVGSDRETLAAAGFCAVLYDRDLAVAAKKTLPPVALQGAEVSALGKPDYENERYSVFMLAPPPASG